jgi:hypothetical protein
MAKEMISEMGKPKEEVEEEGEENGDDDDSLDEEELERMAEAMIMESDSY